MQRRRNIYRTWMISALAGVAIALAGAAHASSEEADGFIADARARLERGDVKAAAIQLKNALRADPGNLEARLLLGKALIATRDFDTAEKNLRAAYNVDPTDEVQIALAQALYGLTRFEDVLDVLKDGARTPENGRLKTVIRGEALLKLQRYASAAEAAETVLRQKPDSAPALYLAARAHFAQAEVLAAQTDLDRILKTSPDFADAWTLKARIALRVNDFALAESSARKAQALSPGDVRAAALLIEAQIRRGRFGEAKAAIDAFKPESKTDPRPNYLRAMLAAAQGNYAEADHYLIQIQAWLSREPAGPFFIGLVKYRAGYPAQAEAQLRRYLVGAPKDRAAQGLLAEIEIEAKRYATARDVIDDMLRADPSDAAALRLLASLQTRQGDYEAALATLRKIGADHAGAGQSAAERALLGEHAAYRDAKTSVTQYLLQATDFLNAGKPDLALDAAQKAVAAAPDDPVALNMLGVVHIARNEDSDARAALERALAAHPGFAEALRNLDRLDVRAGNPAAIEARLRDAVAAAPDDPALVVRLASYLEIHGRPGEARQMLDAARARFPASLDLRAALLRIALRTDDKKSLVALAEDLKALGRSKPKALALAAKAYAGADEHAAAAAAYGALRARDLANPALSAAYAGELRANGQAQEARKVLETALERAPDAFEVRRALVELALARGDAAAAETLANPDDPEQTALLKAAIASTQGRAAEAVGILKTAMDAAPSPALARALFAARTRAGDAKDARRGLAVWAAYSPGDVESLLVLAHAYIGADALADADRVLSAALQARQDDPRILNDLAWVRDALGRPGGIDLARRAYTAAPASAEIADTLGWMLVRAGKANEGLRLLREAAANAPDDLAIAYHLARARAAAGEREKGLEAVQTLVAAHPEFPEREDAVKWLAANAQ